MKCERCQGGGFVYIVYTNHNRDKFVRELTPCPDCNGCGIAHCCEGLVANGEEQHGE